jgi:hypothetical protein
LFFGDVASIESSNFDSVRRTKVLVHGYTDNGRTGWIKEMTEAYLAVGK